MIQTKHEFAFFVPEITQLEKASKSLILKESVLVHRIVHILRLSVGETLVLFDATQNAQCSIVEISKKSVRVSVLNVAENTILRPSINWILPILEREAFEEAIYALAVMGAVSITPVITHKSRRKWGTQKERERIERIMIAAAEQSKHFALPKICETKSLREALIECSGQGLFFDVAGDPAFTVVQQLRQKKIKDLTCLVGPEGDLTVEEKKAVQDSGFMECQLTPTVLRACHAVMVGMGIMRSCVDDNF